MDETRQLGRKNFSVPKEEKKRLCGGGGRGECIVRRRDLGFSFVRLKKIGLAGKRKSGASGDRR